jgi:putative membrane protein
MPADNTQPPAAKSTSELALLRTRMASERTLMAWIRTSLSMLSFGFTIYKVLQAVQTAEHAVNHVPRNTGLVLIGLGVLSMLLGTIEYWTTQQDLNVPVRLSFRRPTLALAFVLLFGGTGLFASIISKMF